MNLLDLKEMVEKGSELEQAETAGGGYAAIDTQLKNADKAGSCEPSVGADVTTFTGWSAVR